jgi:hypothetical protein
MYFMQHSDFARRASGGYGWPDDGSTYLVSGNSLVPVVAALEQPGRFDLISLDLAEYSDVVPDAVTVHFVGYRPDGSTVTTDRTTDGIMDGTSPLRDFETFYFEGFTGLNRLEMGGSHFSLDNMVVVIPEPTTSSLLVLGALVVSASRRRRASSPNFSVVGSEGRRAAPARKFGRLRSAAIAHLCVRPRL